MKIQIGEIMIYHKNGHVEITMEENDSISLTTSEGLKGSMELVSNFNGKLTILADQEIIDIFKYKTLEDNIID